MDAELTKLLAHLQQDGVTELVLGSGQPVTVRRGGAYTAASTDIVSSAQLARWLLGSGFEELLPSGDGIGEPGDVQIGAHRYAVQITRRGGDLLVRVENARAPAPPVISARTRSRAIKRPTPSPPVASAPRREPAPPQPPAYDAAAVAPASVLELGPPDAPTPAVAASSPYEATFELGDFASLPDLMPEGPMSVAAPPPRATPTPAPRAAPRDRGELLREAMPTFEAPGLDDLEIELPRSAPAPRAAEPPPRAPEPAPLARTQSPQPSPVAARTITTPPAEGPVARAPRAQTGDPAPRTPPSRSLRDADEKPNTDLIAQVVRAARQRGASDLHVAANRPLLVRAIGELIPLDRAVLPAADAEKLLTPLLGAASREVLATRGYVDIAIEIPGAGRLRGNISRVQGGLKGSFRLAYPQPPTLEELNLPKELAKVVSHHQGLVVFAGPSGHGKTTTLAALVDLINSTRPHHILTIEDPVEIEHPRKRAVVSQREVGRHTKSFAAALKASLREDPDVIVIGELRDRETVEIALTAAETGHLVMATMSTPSAAKTIDRLIDMFPPDDQQQVRASLGGALRAIVAQRLVPRADNGAVLPAIELLTGVLPLVSLIRDNKLFQLPNLMQRGKAFGMIRLDDSLAELVRTGMITEEVALRVSDNKRDLTAALRGPLAQLGNATPPSGVPAIPGGAPAAAPAAPTAPKKGGLGSLFGRKDRE